MPITKASEIEDSFFISTYSDGRLSNAQVLKILDCRWPVLQSKMRNKHIRDSVTRRRVGGENGTHYPSYSAHY
jgi:hypothetical protein